MPERAVYDTRFFIDYFYSDDAGYLKQLKQELRNTRERLVSTVTIYETYSINQQREGRDVANLRSETIRRDFTVIPLTYDISVEAARTGAQQNIPIANCVIAATATEYTAPVVTDDPHFKEIKDIRTRWPRK